MGVKLDGSLAYLFRRLAYLYRMPTLNHQLKVGFNWIAREQVTFAQGQQIREDRMVDTSVQA